MSVNLGTQVKTVLKMMGHVVLARVVTTGHVDMASVSVTWAGPGLTVSTKTNALPTAIEEGSVFMVSVIVTLDSKGSPVRSKSTIPHAPTTAMVMVSVSQVCVIVPRVSPDRIALK